MRARKLLVYADASVIGDCEDDEFKTDSLALHIALATIHRVDVLVSWNFRHIVNFGRIRLSNAVNFEEGLGSIEIRTPSEVLDYD